jgi:hypothetical protein
VNVPRKKKPQCSSYCGAQLLWRLLLLLLLSGLLVALLATLSWLLLLLTRLLILLATLVLLAALVWIAHLLTSIGLKELEVTWADQTGSIGCDEKRGHAGAESGGNGAPVVS